MCMFSEDACEDRPGGLLSASDDKMSLLFLVLLLLHLGISGVFVHGTHLITFLSVLLAFFSRFPSLLFLQSVKCIMNRSI